MANRRTLKSGQVLLKPGDKLQNVYVVQSGRLSICHVKNSKTVEVAQLVAPQSIGDDLLFGPSPWQFTVIALRETVVIEIPILMLKTQYQQSSPQFKVLLKGLSDRAKGSFAEVKTMKMNREALPCPADNVAKAFGVIYHTARAIGTRAGDNDAVPTSAGWDAFKKYALEVFDEPTVRLEDAVSILVKLGYAKFQSDSLCLTDLNQVEAFFDYYGNYRFRGGYDEFLKTNVKMEKVTEAFLQVAEGHEIDRGGNVHIPYKAAIDAMKVILGPSFEADQLFRLEQKGLFMKRTANQDGGVLSFYKPDFVQMMLNWKVLHELESWNEKGFVELGQLTAAPGVKDESSGTTDSPLDPEAERKKWAKALSGWKPAMSAADGKGPRLRTGAKSLGEIWCTVCMSVVQKAQKTCHVCGSEVAKAA